MCGNDGDGEKRRKVFFHATTVRKGGCEREIGLLSWQAGFFRSCGQTCTEALKNVWFSKKKNLACDRCGLDITQVHETKEALFGTWACF